jgi:methionine-rich copper-binding protein CopC
MKPMLRRALAALALVAVSQGPAQAHAYLVDSVPAKKQEVMNPLDQIRLVFSRKADAHFSIAKLLDAHGAVISEVTQEKAAPEMVLPAPALRPGQYRVHYRVLSVDGDVVEGEVGFTVARGSA